MFVTTRSAPKTWGQTVAWVGMTILSVGIAIFSYRYLFAAGPMPPVIASNSRFGPWIVIHAAGAATALLVGPVQFLSALRQNKPFLHRILGRIYVAGCLIGGVSALVLATGVSTGPVTGIGFGTLGVAWLLTTGVALRAVLSGRIASHRRWMVRSFALTLAAVTLRIYLPLSDVLGIGFAASYPVIAWLCWVPNMALAEWYLRSGPGGR